MSDFLCRRNFGKFINVRNVVVVLLSALFFSCEDPVGISVDLPSTGSLTTIFTDTISVQRTTVKLDSSVTSGTSFALVGSYTDPDFGKVTAESFANVSLLQRQLSSGFSDYFDLDLGATAVYDSIRLTLVPISFSYGKDTLTKTTLSVHLLDNILATKRFNYSEKASYQSTPLVSRAINLKDLKTKAGADSSVIFKLPDDLGKKIFDLSGKITVKKTINNKEEVFGDNTKLNAIIKGIAIKLDGKADVIYSFSVPQCTIILYYHTLDASGNVETNSSGSARKSYPLDLSASYFTNYVADYKGKALEKAVSSLAGLPSTQAQGLSYIQNGLGIITKLDMPFFKNQTSSGLAINKAELVITPKKADYSFPSALGLAEINANNDISRISGIEQFATLDNNEIAAPMDTSKKYTLNITSFLQTYIGKKTKSSIALVPFNYFVSSQGTATYLRNTDTRRMILDANSVKLKVYYSAAKK